MLKIHLIVIALGLFQTGIMATDIISRSPTKRVVPGVSPDTANRLDAAIQGKPASRLQNTSATNRPLPIPPSINTNTCSVACQNSLKMSPVIVLSIDGASVRGIAQFKLLQALERQVIDAMGETLLVKQKATNSNIPTNLTDIFDFYAGTSAGSLNVGSLLIPADPSQTNITGQRNKPKYTTTELHAMLPELLSAAFNATPYRKVRVLGGLMGSKYTAKKLQKKLEEITRQVRMSDIVKPAIITSYDVRHREIMNFSTYDACRTKKPEESTFMMPDQNGHMISEINVYLWQAMRASSAAPVYYKPLEMKMGGKIRALIDAGLYVMSPALLAWTEVQKIYPCRRILIISIASGNLVDNIREIRSKGATAGSIPDVLQATIETALEGQQLLTDKMMHDLANTTYHRLTFDVISKELDDVSEKNIKALEQAAEASTDKYEFKDAVKAIVAALLERQKDSQPTVFICNAKVADIHKEKIAKEYFGPEQYDKYMSTIKKRTK